MAFASQSELEDFVGHTIYAERATLLLDLASAAVASAARVPIAEGADHVDTLDGSGHRIVLLSRYPVTAVSEVTVDGDAIDVDDFTWSRAGVIERATGVWPAGRRNVVVTYTHGYAAADVPADIKLVCLTVAGRLLANPQGLRAYGSDGTTAQFTAASLTDDERELVARALT